MFVATCPLPFAFCLHLVADKQLLSWREDGRKQKMEKSLSVILTFFFCKSGKDSYDLM